MNPKIYNIKFPGYNAFDLSVALNDKTGYVSAQIKSGTPVCIGYIEPETPAYEIGDCFVITMGVGKTTYKLCRSGPYLLLLNVSTGYAWSDVVKCPVDTKITGNIIDNLVYQRRPRTKVSWEKQ